MSKELEALNYFLEKQDSLEKYGSSGSFNIAEQREKLIIIETALKRLEELDKHQLSIRSLTNEETKQLMEKHFVVINNNKQDEILRIIKEKRVDIRNFCVYLEVIDNFDYESYIAIQSVSPISSKKLTQEEFDLLKEWLC